MATPSNSTAPTPTVPDLSASCTTAAPGKYGNVPIDACNSYYNFNPQYAPALAVTVLFGILTTVHIAEAFIFKKVRSWIASINIIGPMLTTYTASATVGS
jgi:hypothetical protein